jgi:hypothetical protein
MSLNDPLSSSSTWIIRGILWSVALVVVFMLGYKVMYRKQVERTVSCLDKATAASNANTPLKAVDGYAACVRSNPASVAASSGAGDASSSGSPDSRVADSRPARCRYAGVWSATRDRMVYRVTLEAEGRFVAEPWRNVPPGAGPITGAWGIAGNAMTWVYDKGPVWPPDINPISNDAGDAFTLKEVNGATTRYELIERDRSFACT